MLFTFGRLDLSAHCQLPCGIYHDDMIYDLIDQYAETMYKGITVMNQSKLDSVHDFNELTRWVIEKEKESNETAQLITFYFLQQKIKPGEPETTKRLEAAHKLLFLLVAIKQNNEIRFVDQFAKQWEDFKLMFHPEGYECKVEMLKLKKKQEELKTKSKSESPVKANTESAAKASTESK